MSAAVVYLLHFERPYPGGRRPQHYMGVAADLEKRVAEHRRGNQGKGGALTRAIAAQGITFLVARVWACETADEAFRLERKLKAGKQYKRHCYLCNEAKVAADQVSRRHLD